VVDALYQFRGEGEKGQGLRTVKGLAAKTRLPATQVKGILTSHPELFFLAKQPSRRGDHLYGLRSSAAVGPRSRSFGRTDRDKASPTDSVHDAGGEGPAPPADTEESVVLESAPIFVVHGHNRAVLLEVVRVIERAASRDATVLHEQANAGRTILEKFEEHAAAASYAVVLLTDDDVGGAIGATPKPRGRQNVIFELGYFFAKLGRKRTAVLLSPGVEEPSDMAGLVYIEIDAAGAWKYALARELIKAGIPVDHERIP
jgi:Predicted nucleotide-binding protein containing TIR-like domain